jgi:DNA-binding transcriptional regulator LsrR (DeoR family)
LIKPLANVACAKILSPSAGFPYVAFHPSKVMKDRAKTPSSRSPGPKPSVLKSAYPALLTEEEALAKVTWLYYHRKLTQEQIGQELGLSRPSVARYLRRADEQGLVTISLRRDLLERMELSTAIAQQFNLREVYVVPTAKADLPADVMHAVSKMGALYLQSNVKPDQILAVAWGRTLLEVARALENHPVKGLVVAQSFGGLNNGESFNPLRVTSLVAEKFHARVYHLYVPAITATKELREVLLADAGIRSALDVARHASCFMAGIGILRSSAMIVESGFLDLPTLDRLKALGAVGDISARYFNIKGQHITGDIEDRIIGLSWDDLAKLDNVVAIACGTEKTEAIIGALRTGLLHVLITDDQTAKAVLAYVSSAGSESDAKGARDVP